MFKTCAICQQIYSTKPCHASRRKYCSRKCFEKAHSVLMKGDNNPSFLHGHTKNRTKAKEYESWSHMWGRCTNPKNKSWKNYGGRGIEVCKEWRDFRVFYTDMGPSPSPIHQIERINNEGHYTKENCKWATPAEQSKNRRSNINVTYLGRTQCLKEWCKELGLIYARTYARFRSGRPLDQVFSTKELSRANHS